MGGSSVAQRIRHGELQTVGQRLRLWINNIDNVSLVQLHLRETLWHKTTCNRKEKAQFSPSC